MTKHDALAQRFHEARCLAAGGRADDAHPLLMECVAGDVACAQFAAAFLNNLAQRAGEYKTTHSKADEHELKRALGAQNWDLVAKIGPRLLAASPRRLPLLLAMAAACEGRGAAAAQAVYLKAAADLARDNAEVQRQAAKVLARLERFDEAISCWQAIASITGDDGEAGRMIAALTIAKSRRKAGLEADEPQAAAEGASSAGERREAVTRCIVTHPEALAPPAAEPAGVPLNLIQRLEAALRDRPSIPDLYLRLAQLYLDKDRDYDAERLLRKGRDATENDARVLQMWEEVALMRHEQRLQVAEREAAASANPQTQAAVEQAAKELARAALEIYRSRLKRDPANAANQYELGRCLARGEKVRDAASHFEQALADERIRPLAALELGRCLERQGEASAALKHYRLAGDCGGLAQRNEQIAALLAAGKLALKIKLARLAQRYLARLLRLDPNHREAAAIMQSM